MLFSWWLSLLHLIMICQDIKAVGAGWSLTSVLIVRWMRHWQEKYPRHKHVETLYWKDCDLVYFAANTSGKCPAASLLIMLNAVLNSGLLLGSHLAQAVAPLDMKIRLYIWSLNIIWHIIRMKLYKMNISMLCRNVPNQHLILVAGLDMGHQTRNTFLYCFYV